VRETFSPKLVEAFVNHPDVRPTMQTGDYRLEAGDILANPDNVVFASEAGVVLFIYKGNGSYAGHMAFLPDKRGKVALRDAASARDRLFRDYGAQQITVAVPSQLRHVSFLVRRLGFALVGRDNQQEFFVMERASWAA
jgi:hypothetical protein